MLQPFVAYPIWVAIRQEAEHAGASVSQYVADLLAVHVGRPDLVSTWREKLPQRAPVQPSGRVLVATRPLREVCNAIHQAATTIGTTAGPYVADILAIHVGRPDLARVLGRQEELLLAI